MKVTIDPTLKPMDMEEIEDDLPLTNADEHPEEFAAALRGAKEIIFPAEIAAQIERETGKSIDEFVAGLLKQFNASH